MARMAQQVPADAELASELPGARTVPSSFTKS